MLRHLTHHSVIMVLTLLVGLLSLGVQSMPSGSLLCTEQNGEMVLETDADECCAKSSVSSEGVGSSSLLTVQVISATCSNCVDLAFPHDHFALNRMPTVAGAVALSDLPLVAIINWIVASPAPPRAADVAYVRPSYLVQLATIVIRC